MRLTLIFLAFATISHAEPVAENVLFLISDDLKASVLGTYGDKFCETPNIDRLAERGMVFENTYCQGTWCKPSRISLMHSRYRDSKNPSLGEHLQKNGMFSGRVGKIYHMRVPGDIIAGTDGEDVAACWTEKVNTQGLEAHTPGHYALLNHNIFTTELENRQSTRMPHRMFVSVRYEGDGSDQPDYQAASETIKMLQRQKDGPFFIGCGFVRPHYPNVAPQQYFDLYPYSEMPLPEVPEGDLDDIPKAGRSKLMNDNSGIGKYPDNIRRMWTAYYATVTYMDEQVGRVLDELDRLGLTDSTAIVFTSDHGYHLGEHTFWQKSNYHEEVARVPMIISAPGMKPGRSKSMTELTDIYPTVCELLGVEIPEETEGKSLVPILKDPSVTVRDGALSLEKNSYGLRTKGWAYMSYEGGAEEELYDMTNDPEQFTNLARNPEHTEMLTAFREKLSRHPAKLSEPTPGKKKNGKKP